MNENVEKLRNLSRIILFENKPFSSLYTMIDELFQLFNDASGCTYEDEAVRKNIYLSEGKAIGTCWAALCVKEIMRTQKFLQGIYKAILSAKNKFPGEPLQILYAGTGPFAALAIPFTTLFLPKELQFTFLEINPESFRMLNHVIGYFNCQDYISAMELCDATKFRPYPDKRFHIIISETMQQALIKEPQVSITLNLLPLLAFGGFLIPENIQVNCAVMNMKKNSERMMNPDFHETYYYNLGQAFELNQNTPDQFSSAISFNNISFPMVHFQIPDPIDSDYNEVFLMTKITVFDDIILTDWQCSLTLPYRLKLASNRVTPGKRFGLQYVISDSPHYAYIPIE